MKTPVLALFMTACCFMSAVNLFSQAVPAIKSQPLTYIESSAGLANPEWEGGRTELEFADIDQDGHIDIITIGDHGSPYINSGETGIMVYFGDGLGNWNVQMTGDFGYGGIAAGDANNDGYMDFIAGYEYSTCYFGDGEGGFTLNDQNLPDNGRYQWLVPQENSEDCYIRYTITTQVTAYSSLTPVAFTITDGMIGMPEFGVGTDDYVIYPNPAWKKLTVTSKQSAVRSSQFPVNNSDDCELGTGNWELNSAAGISCVINKLTVADLFGREYKVFEKISSFPFQIDITDLQQGIYVVRIIHNDGQTANLRFLKISD